MPQGMRTVNERIDKPAVKKPLVPTPHANISPPATTPSQALQRALSTPALARPADILHLQRTLGNRAVGALLARSVPQRPLIQAKLTVNAPGDQYEEEADRVAEQVMQMPAVQREELEEDEKLEIPTLPDIQRSGDGVFEVDKDFERQLGVSRGQGHPLPPNLREEFESAFGMDFSGVRIHADVQSDVLNRSVQAKASTHGLDVYMGSGHYSPDSTTGKRLLAHELTHVVQQNRLPLPLYPLVENHLSRMIQRRVGFEIETGIPITKKGQRTTRTGHVTWTRSTQPGNTGNTEPRSQVSPDFR